MEMDLDAWLPDPAITSRHRRTARSDPDRLWEAALSVRLRDTPTLGRVVRWRIPRTPASLTYRELFSRYPFTVLDEGERWTVSGLCGRIWTVQRDYPRVSSAEEFLEWDEPGTARVLMAHWVTDDSVLWSEARVSPHGGRASMRLRAVWAVVGRFERLIGGEALRVAARRAERG